MNVLHVNTYDTSGGAAVAMYRLHGELRRLGHQSQLLVGHQTTPGPDIDYISRQARHFRTMSDKVLDRIGILLEGKLGVDIWAYRNSWHISQISAFRNADVVNLHNIHGDYFNFRALPEMGRHKPIVWTLHDMWAMTGHCAYVYDCERWRTGCYACPLLKEPGRKIVEPPPMPIDRTRSIWRAKRDVYQQMQLHIITPSQWLASLVRESILSSAVSVQCIPNGIDLDVFRPMDREIARQVLDLPVDSRIIFFSAHGVMHGRKGFLYFLRALESLQEPRSIWLLVSGGKVELDEQATRFKVRQLGSLRDEHLQRLAFTAADVFVFPTLADNQPLVLLEALACGTPVISFDVDGIPEIIRHMETGYLARYKDVNDLSQGIQMLLKNDDLRRRMRLRCRKMAEKEYSLELQARRYVALYEEAVKRHRRWSAT